MHADKLVKFLNKIFHKKQKKDAAPFNIPKKVLLILPDFIGDVLLITPVIRNLRYNLGDSVVIDIIGNSNSKNLLETLPYHNNIYIEQKKIGFKKSFLKKHNYDSIYLFNFRFFWAWAVYQTKTPQRIGFSLEKLGLENIFLWQNFLTHIIKSSTVYDKKHQIDIYLKLLKELNFKINDNYPEVILAQNDINKAKILLNQITAPRCMIHITAGSPGKQWNYENWFSVIKYLNKKYSFSILATGSEADKKVYDRLSAQTGIHITNFCGQTSIRETIALYKHINLAITLDTSAAHFAAAAGTKNIIVIYGPTNEFQWKPYTQSSYVQQICLNLECRPCITRMCRNRKCINSITPEMIIDAVGNIKPAII
jgi:ADP-heptose:LPS heptosyltransferase